MLTCHQPVLPAAAVCHRLRRVGSPDHKQGHLLSLTSRATFLTVRSPIEAQAAVCATFNSVSGRLTCAAASELRRAQSVSVRTQN